MIDTGATNLQILPDRAQGVLNFGVCHHTHVLELNCDLIRDARGDNAKKLLDGAY